MTFVVAILPVQEYAFVEVNKSLLFPDPIPCLRAAQFRKESADQNALFMKRITKAEWWLLLLLLELAVPAMIVWLRSVH